MNPAQLTVLQAFLNMQVESTVNGDLKTDGEDLIYNGNLIATHHHSGEIRINLSISNTASNHEEISRTVEIWNALHPDLTVIQEGIFFMVNGINWGGYGWGKTGLRSVSSRTQPLTCSLSLSDADDTTIIAFTRGQSINILGSKFKTDGSMLWLKDNGVDRMIAGIHLDRFIHICCPYSLSPSVYELYKDRIVLIIEAWRRLHRDFNVTRDRAEFFINNNRIGWDGNGWFNTQIAVSSRTQDDVLSVGEMSVINAFLNRESREDGNTINGGNYRLKTDGDRLWLNGYIISAHSDAEGVARASSNPPHIWLKCLYTIQHNLEVEELHHTVLIWNNLHPRITVNIEGLYFVINGRAWNGEGWCSSQIRSKPNPRAVSSRTHEVVNAFLRKRIISSGILRTDGHKLAYEGSTIAKHDNGKILVRMGLCDHEEKIKVLLMIPGIDSIVGDDSSGYLINGRRWDGQWFVVGLGGSLESKSKEFDVTSIWMDKLKYNKPKFAVADTTKKESLEFVMFILNENNIEFKQMKSDTYGKYEPHYFLIVKPHHLEEAKSLLINKQQVL